MKELEITVTNEFFQYLLKKYNFTSKDDITNDILIYELNLNTKKINKEMNEDD